MPQFILCRPDVRAGIVGPFASERAAQAWQRADTAMHGVPGDWTLWPLHAPAEASAGAARGKAPPPATPDRTPHAELAAPLPLPDGRMVAFLVAADRDAATAILDGIAIGRLVRRHDEETWCVLLDGLIQGSGLASLAAARGWLARLLAR